MKNTKTGLEDFVGRNRADFDAFEPRPDLWEAIERDLEATPTVAAEAPLRVIPLPLAGTTPTLAPRKQHYASYSLAAVLALLLLAGAGVWFSQSRHSGWMPLGKAVVVAEQASQIPAAGPNSRFDASPVAAAADSRSKVRVTAAVQSMEHYYAAQLTDRQAQLAQLEQAQPTAPADWKKELAALDSTYQQLKVELARNPEPDVVLDAMNRNFQIRLDILNQELRTREQVQESEDATPVRKP